MTVSSRRDPLAAEVLALLRSAPLIRRDETLGEAARRSIVSAPRHLEALTPRFEAYFAIATLARALTNRESRDLIERRFALAVLLTETWLKAPVGRVPSKAR